jgi:hypothetical protein
MVSLLQPGEVSHAYQLDSPAYRLAWSPIRPGLLGQLPHHAKNYIKKDIHNYTSFKYLEKILCHFSPSFVLRSIIALIDFLSLGFFFRSYDVYTSALPWVLVLSSPNFSTQRSRGVVTKFIFRVKKNTKFD